MDIAMGAKVRVVGSPSDNIEDETYVGMYMGDTGEVIEHKSHDVYTLAMDNGGVAMFYGRELEVI